MFPLTQKLAPTVVRVGQSAIQAATKQNTTKTIMQLKTGPTTFEKDLMTVVRALIALALMPCSSKSPLSLSAACSMTCGEGALLGFVCQ